MCSWVRGSTISTHSFLHTQPVSIHWHIYTIYSCIFIDIHLTFTVHKVWTTLSNALGPCHTAHHCWPLYVGRQCRSTNSDGHLAWVPSPTLSENDVNRHHISLFWCDFFCPLTCKPVYLGCWHSPPTSHAIHLADVGCQLTSIAKMMSVDNVGCHFGDRQGRHPWHTAKITEKIISKWWPTLSADNVRPCALANRSAKCRPSYVKLSATDAAEGKFITLTLIFADSYSLNYFGSRIRVG